jgi:predicted nucleic acid-binding protein
LIDVLGQDPVWGEWSLAALAGAGDEGAVLVDQVIYAEVSVGFTRIEECERAIDARGIERIPLPWSAAFLAGKAFLDYRRRGGPRRSPLPDFYIGAHAAVSGYRLLTRDPGRYRTYFPTVELVSPE